MYVYWYFYKSYRNSWYFPWDAYCMAASTRKTLEGNTASQPRQQDNKPTSAGWALASGLWCSLFVMYVDAKGRSLTRWSRERPFKIDGSPALHYMHHI